MKDNEIVYRLEREPKENLIGLILDLCQLDKNNRKRLKDLILKR